MRKVEVAISSPDRNDTSGVAVILESKGPAGALRRDEARTVAVNSGVQSFQLRPGQRLVVEAALQDEDLVYDRDQGASVRRSNQVQDPNRADRPNAQPTQDERTRLDQADQRRKAEAKASGMTEAEARGQFRTPEASPQAAQPKSGSHLQEGGTIASNTGQKSLSQQAEEQRAKQPPPAPQTDQPVTTKPLDTSKK